MTGREEGPVCVLGKGLYYPPGYNRKRLLLCMSGGLFGVRVEDGTQDVALPVAWGWLASAASVVAIGVSMVAILAQLLNYRRPSEQRLVVRIQLLVPLFSITCWCATTRPQIAQMYLDPVREFYEAFVIYTFFSLLTLVLGGERAIITELAVSNSSRDEPPTQHALPWLGTVDLADPGDFLAVKRGVLQYVWFKPFYCLMLLVCEVLQLNDAQFWLLILYNLSVTWSLYNLAVFWRCLYRELQPYHPWPKFLCVKLIIFASYWQGILVRSLHFLGVFGEGAIAYRRSYIYENGILCVEMVGFAFLHLYAFPVDPYASWSLPLGARMQFLYAVRDVLGGGDLKWDFKQTLLVGQTYYNYRNFDAPPESLINSRRHSHTTMKRLNQGYRFTSGAGETPSGSAGTHTSHWVGYGSIKPGSQGSNVSQIQDEPWDMSMCEDSAYIPTDPHYPVVWESAGHRYSPSINRLKQSIAGRDGAEAAGSMANQPLSQV